MQNISCLYRIFLVYTGYFWFIQDISGLYRIFLVYTGYFWFIQDISGLYRIFLVFTGYNWFNNYNYRLVPKTPLLACNWERITSVQFHANSRDSALDQYLGCCSWSFRFLLLITLSSARSPFLVSQPYHWLVNQTISINM